MKHRKLHLSVAAYLSAFGLASRAISLELDEAGVTALPESQRGWYAKDTATGKFKLDPAKVEIEDVGGLKSAAQAAREERDKIKRESAEKERALLERFQGIDPEKVRKMMAQFENDEEAALIAAGKIPEVVERRMEKSRAALAAQLTEADSKVKAADARAAAFERRVLDNEIRAAVGDRVHPAALKNGDVLRAAREIFTLDKDGKAVQLDKDGQVVLGKDSKTPFTVEEWIESQKPIAPHWFPIAGSGGGGPGSKNTGTMPDMSGMSATQRMTAARENTKPGK